MNYIKVFVDGTYSSGKTTFIQQLSEIDVISTELTIPEDNDSIACDFGRLTIDDKNCLVWFGAPGARRLDVTQSLYDDVFGVVFVVDSAFLIAFREAKAKLNQWLVWRDVPIVVVANKQDRPNPWSPDDLRIALRIPDDIPIIPCSTKTGEGVNEVMIALGEAYLRWSEF